MAIAPTTIMMIAGVLPGQSNRVAVTHDMNLAFTFRERYDIGTEHSDKDILSAYNRWRQDGAGEQEFLTYLQ